MSITADLEMPSSRQRDVHLAASGTACSSSLVSTDGPTTADQLQCDPHHKQLILKQLNRIDSLEQELAGVRSERDILLAENEKLCFQLQMLSECYNGTKRNFADLQAKNLLNGVTSSHSNEPNNNSTLIQNANPKTFNQSSLNAIKMPTSGSLNYRTLHNPHRKLNMGGNVTTNGLSNSSVSNTITSDSTSNSSTKNMLTYEFSQEMIDKRVELLQRKYGEQAWAAAICIQRFWRKRQMSQRFRNIALNVAQNLESQQNQTNDSKANDSNSFNKSIVEPESMDLVDVANTEIILNDNLPLNQNCANSNNNQRETIESGNSVLSGSSDSAISGLSSCSVTSSLAANATFVISNSISTSSNASSNVNQLIANQLPTQKPILKRYSNASLHSNSSTGSSGSSICRSPTLPSMTHNAPVAAANSAGLLFGVVPGHPHLLYTTASGQFVTSNGSAALLQQPIQLTNSTSAQMLSSVTTGSFAPNHFQTQQQGIANQSVAQQAMANHSPNQTNYVQLLPNQSALANQTSQLMNVVSNISLAHSQCSQMSLTSNCMPLSPNRSSMCSTSSLISNGTGLPIAISASQLPHLQLAQYEILRKRQYRVGLNLFNKQPPERGIQYLIDNGFIDANLISYANASAFAEMALNPLDSTESDSPTNSNGSSDLPNGDQHLAAAVAHFLLTRKGLSKQMIGEYLGNLQRPFNQLVLRHFVRQLDLSGLAIDVALRKYQTYFRFPGEAQKIERLVEVFAEKYYQCNFECGIHPTLLGLNNQTMSKDEIFILSFAIIMLNTDLHVPNNKRRMTPQQWLKNLQGVFKENGDLEEDFLLQIYERIKQNEFKTGHDHCNHVLKVQQTLVSSSSSKPVPNLCLTTYRRLVCFCRLYEIVDLNKKTTKAGQHQREVFLFNDMLLVTKLAKSGSNSLGAAISSSQSNGGSNAQNLYTYRRSIMLSGCHVSLFSTNYYPFGIRISAAGTGNSSSSSSTNSNSSAAKPIIMFNARNDIDRKKFYEDLRESIAEITEMEMIRISAGTNSSSGASGARMIGSTALAGNFSPTHSLQSKSNSLLDLTNCPATAIHSNGTIQVYGKQSKLI